MILQRLFKCLVYIIPDSSENCPFQFLKTEQKKEKEMNVWFWPQWQSETWKCSAHSLEAQMNLHTVTFENMEPLLKHFGLTCDSSSITGATGFSDESKDGAQHSVL